MKVTSYSTKGNSFPITIEDEEQKYFVKLKAGMSGQYGLITEWIGNKIGLQLGIKTQLPYWIHLNNSLIVDDLYIEVKELITKSYGTNIGFKYLEDVTEINFSKVNHFSKSQFDEIYLFDLMMINLDRTESNMNLMKVEDQIISVDYESSMLIQEILECKNLLTDDRVLQGLRNNPLYKNINENQVDEFILKINTISIDKIIEEIPIELLSADRRTILKNGFNKKRKNNWQLKETLAKLKNINKVSNADKKLLRARNQAAFKRKFKENINNIK